VSQED